jgi:hypothetical protein
MQPKRHFVREFYSRRFKWAKKGSWGMVELIALLAGLILAVLVWWKPDWTHAHISERMNGFILGTIPLLSGLSVFLVRWFLSSFFVYKAERLKREELTNKRPDFFYQGNGSEIALNFRINPQTNRPVAMIELLLRFENGGEGTAYNLGAEIYGCWINDEPPSAFVIDKVEPSVGRTPPHQCKSLGMSIARDARQTLEGQLGLNSPKDVFVILVEIEFRRTANDDTICKNEPIWLTWNPQIHQRMSDAGASEMQVAKLQIDQLKAQQQ